ncbi:MAG: transcription termination factor NusA [Planctomycetota bacterium]|jgi:N utilization substance protein A
MNGELLRIVDAIHRDKAIDKEVIFIGIEQALLSAARKRFGQEEDLIIEIDRETGGISATAEGKEIDPIELGRIAAQTAKQVIIQKIREAERDVIYTDYETRRKDIVHGSVSRIEGPNIIVNLGKAEAILPKKEQVPEELYNVGDRLRVFIVDVKKISQKVKIIVSRSHPELVRRLFELEVPEIADGIIVIQNLVREAGYRTKIAVISTDPKVDSVGACVGVRGSRIKSIIDELSGEKIDIIRWSEASDTLIANALKPAQIRNIELDDMNGRATVIVDEDQLSLAIGKRGQNVRLASRLAKWEIDIMTEEEALERRNRIVDEFKLVPNLSLEMADALYAYGYNSLAEIAERGADTLTAAPGFDETKATQLLEAINDLARESIRARREAVDEPPGGEVESPEAGTGPPADAAEANEAADPAEASTDDGTEAPTEDPAEAPAEDSAEAPAEDPAEAPAEDSAEAPAEDSAEAPTEPAPEPEVSADDDPVPPTTEPGSEPAPIPETDPSGESIED